jgi:hypothetical protein
MRDHEIIGLQEAYLEVCEEGRSARRRKPSKSVEQLKAEISARDEAKAQRATERAAARRPLTPGEKYDQEKATKKDKSSDFSRHRMTGSGGHGSTYSVSSRFKEEFVVNYLLDEGFASDEKSAEAILGAMSEAWVESIVEEVLDEALTGRRGKRAITKFQDQNDRPDRYRKPSENKNPKPNYTLGAVAGHKEGSPNPHNPATPEDYGDSGNRPTKRGGRGEKGKAKTGYYGTDRRDSDRGRGNAARRRMENN